MAKDTLKDPKPCIEIEEKLDQYAEATKDWHIARRQYTDRYGNKYDFNDTHPYPYDDYTESRMSAKINSYLFSLDENEQKLANGRLLFHYKDYLTQPFAKHAIGLIANSVVVFPLNSDDKIKFLEYLFKAEKQDEFDPRILYKLASYNPNENLEATNRLYNKALNYFDGAARKNDTRIATIYGMFKVFSENVESLSPDAAVNYAGIYFSLADRTGKPLDPIVLRNFAIKTPEAIQLAEESKDASVIDKGAVKGILEAYAQHVNSHSTYNEVLANQMELFAKTVIKSYQYNMQEALDLAEVIRPAMVDENGKKVRPSKNRTALNEMADRVAVFARTSSFRQQNPIKHVNRDNPPLDLSNDAVLDYAQFLFKTAKNNESVDIKTSGLYSLLTRSGTMDKGLLLDVVGAYADTYTFRDMEDGGYNSSFHEKMGKMMEGIVIKYDYTDQEVSDLTSRLAKGAEGTYAVEITSSERDMEEYGDVAAYSERRGHDLFQDMARSIRRAYSPADERYDWYEPKSNQTKKAVSPIILTKNGGKGGNS